MFFGASKKKNLSCLDANSQRNHHVTSHARNDLSLFGQPAPRAICRPTYGAYVCVKVYICESRNSCAGNEGDGRRLSGEKEGKRRLVKVSPRGSESTIDTDSGVFSL